MPCMRADADRSPRVSPLAPPTLSQEFSSAKTVEDIIMKHSNFVNFPIFLNGKQVRARGRAHQCLGLDAVHAALVV
jgi:hypothetical protein